MHPKGILLHGGPPSDFRVAGEGEITFSWYMVRTKVTPHHTEVRPPKCTVYIMHNPVTFVIQWHHELFRLDQLA